MDIDQKKIDQLAESMKALCDGYRDTKKILNSQIGAIIENDLSSLNNLIEEQTERYEALQKTEDGFREQLVALFQRYYPQTDHPSLARLIEAVEKPAEELERLRKHLYTEIEKTENVRLKLTELLGFATEYNARTISSLSRLRNGAFENYGANGKIAGGTSTGLGLNHKV